MHRRHNSLPAATMLATVQPTPAPALAVDHVPELAAPRAHTRGRPSLSSPISWLSRASIISSSSKGHSTHSRISEISEPTMVDDTESPITRMAPLGSGAVLVNTPQEAFAHSLRVQTAVIEEEETPEPETAEFPVSVEADAEAEARDTFSPLLTRPIARRAKSPAPQVLSQDLSAISVKSASSSSSLPASPLAASQAEIHQAPSLLLQEMSPIPPPTFSVILLAPMPSECLDTSQVIITLETATDSQRTTLATLFSRPSHLSRYLQTLLPEHSGTGSNPNSPFAPHFSDLFRDPANAVTNQVVPHIFLDRPSAPYTHILSYLRNPSAGLPRSARLQPPTAARYDSLLELLDEARYLDLDELTQLVTSELGRHSLPSSRAHSGASLRNILDQSRASPEIPSDQPRRGSADSLSGGTVVGSPRITSKLLADHYVPPALSLKARARSNSRSDSPRLKISGGWL